MRKMPVGYGMVQTKVMRLKGVSIQAKSLYSLLCSYTGSSDYCYPSIKQLADDLNVSEKSIKNYTNELVKNDLIIKGKKNRNSFSNSNCYYPQFIEDDNVKNNKNDDSIKNSEGVTDYPIEEVTAVTHAIGNALPFAKGKNSEIFYIKNNNNINNNILIESDKSDSFLNPDFEQKNLYNFILSCFLSKQVDNKFTNYQKEGIAIKQLIKKIEQRKNNEDVKTFAQNIITYFYTLTKTDKFYKTHPFLPSRLNSSGIFDSVINLYFKNKDKLMEEEESLKILKEMRKAN